MRLHVTRDGMRLVGPKSVTASGYVVWSTFRLLSDISYSDECWTKKALSMLKECCRFSVLLLSSVVPTDYFIFYILLLLYIICYIMSMHYAATRLLKLPALLRGPAATYLDSLSTKQRRTHDALVTNRKSCFAPTVDRERYHQQFEDTVLRPSEDPKLFLWLLTHFSIVNL